MKTTLCEKIKKIGKKAIVYTSTISLLSISGCMFSYRTISPHSVYDYKPKKVDSQEIEQIDYSRSTWQEAIAHVKTPRQAQEYLNKHFEIDFEELMWGLNFFGIIFFTKGETFKYNHTRRKGICIDYATAAAALLSDDGYQPLLLYVKCDDRIDRHVVFLYKTEEGFGALGTTPEKPIYKTIEGLVTALGDEYERFSIVNLDENYKNREWVDGDVDLQGHPIDKWEVINKNKSETQ